MFEQGNMVESIELSSNLLIEGNNNSDYIEILQIRGYSYMSIADFKSAISDLEKLLKIDSTNIHYYIAISFALWEEGDYISSTDYIEIAHKLYPDDPLILNNLSYNYGELGRFSEALEYASLGLQKDNLSDDIKALLLNNKGYAYIGLMKYNEAIYFIDKSLNINNTNSFAYYFRALANIGLEKFETVCDDLATAKNYGGLNLTKDLIKKYCKE